MLWALCATAAGLIHRRTITHDDEVIAGPSFLFKENGIFQLIINNSLPFFFVLLRKTAYDTADRKSLEKGISCSWFMTHRKEFLFPNGSHNIIRHIERANAYYAVIGNCFHGSGSYTLVQANSNSFVDGNHEGLPWFYFSIIFVYLVLGFVWLGNGIIHVQFRIGLHTGLGIVPILKCLHSFSQMRRWAALKTTGGDNLLFVVLTTEFDALSTLSMMVLNTLALYGWGTFQDRIDCWTVVRVAWTCTAFCGFQTVYPLSTWSYIGFVLVFVLWILSTIAYISLLSEIWNSYESSRSMAINGQNPILARKLSLVGQFRAMYLTVFILYTLARITLSLHEEWDILYISTSEILYGVMYVIDLVFFLIKAEHRPDTQVPMDVFVTTDETHVQLPADPVDIRKFVDPNKVCLVVIE